MKQDDEGMHKDKQPTRYQVICVDTENMSCVMLRLHGATCIPAESRHQVVGVGHQDIILGAARNPDSQRIRIRLLRIVQMGLFRIVLDVQCLRG